MQKFRPIRLRQLASRLGFTQQSIVEVLRASGFNLASSNPDLFLTEKQIKFLANVYVQSIETYQRKIRSSNKEQSANENLKWFFRNFLSDGWSLTFEEVLEAKFDVNLIVAYFDRALYTEPKSEHFIHRYIPTRFKLKTPSTRVELNVLNLGIRNTNASHVYPDEEDDNGLVPREGSSIIKTLRGAVVNSSIILKFFLWKKQKYNRSLTEFRIAI